MVAAPWLQGGSGADGERHALRRRSFKTIETLIPFRLTFTSHLVHSRVKIRSSSHCKSRAHSLARAINVYNSGTFVRSCCRTR